MEFGVKNFTENNPSTTTGTSHKGSAIQVYTHTGSQKSVLFLDENAIIFLVSGKLTISYGPVEEQVVANQLVFLKKSILIGYQTEPDRITGCSEYIVFRLNTELVSEFTKMADLSQTFIRETVPFLVVSTNTPFSHFIVSLQAYLFYPEHIQCRLHKMKLMELLFYLASYHKPVLNQLMQLRYNYQNNIIEVIEENILNSISLSQLAVLAGRSLSSFRRDFLFIYNMPPSQWIRQRRLEKAKELLRSTTMSITDICYTTGFENIAHFSRLFKTYFHCSPSGFRQSAVVA